MTTWRGPKIWSWVKPHITPLDSTNTVGYLELCQTQGSCLLVSLFAQVKPVGEPLGIHKSGLRVAKVAAGGGSVRPVHHLMSWPKDQLLTEGVSLFLPPTRIKNGPETKCKLLWIPPELPSQTSPHDWTRKCLLWERQGKEFKQSSPPRPHITPCQSLGVPHKSDPHCSDSGVRSKQKCNPCFQASSGCSTEDQTAWNGAM